MRVILYSNHCPCCDHLEAMLKAENVPFEQVTDVDLMLQRGFKTVPMLEVDGKTMDYPAALAWLRERTDFHED